MKVRPLFDKVVVESLETEEKTNSGFILPSASQEKQQMAKVVAVGPGGIVDGKEITMQVKVGDTVLYAKYSGKVFDLNTQNSREMYKDLNSWNYEFWHKIIQKMNQILDLKGD